MGTCREQRLCRAAREKPIHKTDHRTWRMTTVSPGSCKPFNAIRAFQGVNTLQESWSWIISLLQPMPVSLCSDVLRRDGRCAGNSHWSHADSQNGTQTLETKWLVDPRCVSCELWCHAELTAGRFRSVTYISSTRTLQESQLGNNGGSTPTTHSTTQNSSAQGLRWEFCRLRAFSMPTAVHFWAKTLNTLTSQHMRHRKTPNMVMGLEFESSALTQT